MMENETQLWTWFLFGGALSTHRAKTLLAEWEQRGFKLGDVLQQPTTRAAQLGLTGEEASKLRVPTNLPDVSALRWNEPRYPYGLHNLPFKLRPSLLFYSGDANLLIRPVVYLAPDVISENDQEVLQEVIGMILGENLLLAAFHDSPQAALLLEELNTSEGEVVLLARQGLDQITLSDQEQTLLTTGRLLMVTPLPPGTHTNPAWDPILAQVANAMAARSMHSNTQSLPSRPSSALTAMLISASPAPQPLPPDVQIAASAAEALTWLIDLSAPSVPITPSPEPAGLSPASVEPPPSPEEVLQTLEKGGHVPAVLREKLLGKH